MWINTRIFLIKLSQLFPLAFLSILILNGCSDTSSPTDSQQRNLKIGEVELWMDGKVLKPTDAFADLVASQPQYSRIDIDTIGPDDFSLGIGLYMKTPFRVGIYPISQGGSSGMNDAWGVVSLYSVGEFTGQSGVLRIEHVTDTSIAGSFSFKCDTTIGDPATRPDIDSAFFHVWRFDK